MFRNTLKRVSSLSTTLFSRRVANSTLFKMSQINNTQIRSFGGIWKRPLSKPESPGGKDGEIPTLLEQGVGKNYEEQLAESEGKVLFDTNVVEGHFGTFTNPVLVPSEFPSRIVGCVGAGEREHELMWFDLKAEKKHMCEKCGQIFMLDLSPDTRAAYNEWKKSHPSSSALAFEQYVEFNDYVKKESGKDLLQWEQELLADRPENQDYRDPEHPLQWSDAPVIKDLKVRFSQVVNSRAPTGDAHH